MPTLVLPLRQRDQSGGSMDLLHCPLARRRRRRRWTTDIDTQPVDLRDEAGDRVVVDADGQLGDSRPVLRPVDHAGGSSGLWGSRTSIQTLPAVFSWVTPHAGIR